MRPRPPPQPARRGGIVRLLRGPGPKQGSPDQVRPASDGPGSAGLRSAASRRRDVSEDRRRGRSLCRRTFERDSGACRTARFADRDDRQKLEFRRRQHADPGQESHVPKVN